MNAAEAREAAESLVSTLDLKDHAIEFVEAKAHERFPNEWSIVFDLFSPKGNLIDGPVIVIVDEITGAARLMEGP